MKFDDQELDRRVANGAAVWEMIARALADSGLSRSEEFALLAEMVYRSTSNADCKHPTAVDITEIGMARQRYRCISCGKEWNGELIDPAARSG